MHEESISINGTSLSLTWIHTLIIGSGAAGLNAAVQLRNHGIDDLLIVTEGLDMGTSINTGSDKQTYYKLGISGADADSPLSLAETLFAGGSMHGDLALVEASLSVRAFMHLVNLGIPFPRDKYGQFFGYKTDHDPRQRATSIGPYTSRDMCQALIRRVHELGIKTREHENVVKLVTHKESGHERVVGAIVVRADGSCAAYGAENVVFAVGGPGGLYKHSVYPDVHIGAIGLALMVGAKAQNLPELQFGLASTKFRWNVSGTFMQVIPRFISTKADGVSDEREFLRDYFKSVGEMCSLIFLKGYQWPFDAQKVIGGSSLIDLLVYQETVIRGRRVFLDFRRNADNFSFSELMKEAFGYLKKSGSLLDTPIARLRQMNPEAINVYRNHGIDIAEKLLEIAVCAQHNNGGLAGNIWWESINIKHLFPAGEVNGSHGVYRPGGSALNAGQIAGFRIAEYIANRYKDWTLDNGIIKDALEKSTADVLAWVDRCRHARTSWQEERQELQERMSRVGGHVRSPVELANAINEAWSQWRRLSSSGCSYDNSAEIVSALCNRHLCFAHAVYLEAMLFALKSGVGSRGSTIVLDRKGDLIHLKLGEDWRMLPEDASFRERVLETIVNPDGSVRCEWIPRRAIPSADLWFETGWTQFRNGEIYKNT